MSYSQDPYRGREPYRSRRRRRKAGASRLGLAAALAGAVGVAAVAAVIVVVRPGGDGAVPARPAPALAGGNAGAERGPSVPAPPTGPPVRFTTPEGYGYSLAAVKAGTSRRPLDGAGPPPPGTTYAYADYVLTNSQRRPVLLDFPADLFMPRADVPESARERCMPQAGVPEDMCTLPNRSEITARIEGAKAPIEDSGTEMIPAGASYVVRVASELPVDEDLDAGDLGLYVWNARYTSDRKGVRLSFP